MCRLKKFTDPENSRFKNEKSIKQHTVDSIERRVTRSMKKLISKEEVSINAINALIIPKADRYKSVNYAHSK